ncbi:MAG: transposase [Bacteroidales bacterium]|nr:transposase [Bacteroidales bacterium]
MIRFLLKEFKSLKELTNHFKTQRRCKEYLAFKRWGSNPICPYCGNRKIYTRKDGRYICSCCSRSFSVLVGTIFQNTKLPLLTWFKAIFLMCNCHQGISSCQLSILLGVTQKTAWYILHKIRILLKKEEDDFKDIVSGKIECIQSSKGQMFKVRMSKEHHHLHPEVLKHVMPKSRIYKDDRICHQSISESELSRFNIEDPFPMGFRKKEEHAKTIDVFWLQLKRMVMGIYHFVSFSHFHRYVYEALFRKRNRGLSAGKRFESIIEQIGKVIPYRVISPKGD